MDVFQKLIEDDFLRRSENSNKSYSANISVKSNSTTGKRKKRRSIHHYQTRCLESEFLKGTILMACFARSSKISLGDGLELFLITINGIPVPFHVSPVLKKKKSANSLCPLYAPAKSRASLWANLHFVKTL